MPWLSRRPPGSQQRGEPLGVEVDPLAADVLDHADAGDRVEPLAGEVAVVHDPDLDPVADPGGLGPLPGDPGLRLRQRDPDDLDAVAGRGVGGEAAPAAADVDDPLAGLERQLRADHLELRLLGLLERCRRRGRRSRSCRSSTRRGTAGRTPAAGRSGGGPSGRRAPSCAARRAVEARPGAGREAGSARWRRARRRSAGPASTVASGGGFQSSSRSMTRSMSSISSVAADVGAADAELPRRAERLRDRLRRADPERRAGPVGRVDPGAVPELDRERAVREGRRDLAAQRPGVGERHGPILGAATLPGRAGGREHPPAAHRRRGVGARDACTASGSPGASRSSG